MRNDKKGEAGLVVVPLVYTYIGLMVCDTESQPIS